MHCIPKIFILLVCNYHQQPKALLDTESMNQYNVCGGQEGRDVVGGTTVSIREHLSLTQLYQSLDFTLRK